MGAQRLLPLLRDYWYLVAALGIGLGTGLIVHAHLTGVRQIAPVLVAAVDVPAGATLDDGMLRVAYLPRPAIHPQALQETDQARGRVARMALLAGEQVLDGKLSGGTVAGAVPLEEGERAMFIALAQDQAYPASFIRPGERVDLLFVSEPGRDGDGLARLLLAGVKVLSVHAERGTFGREEAIQGATVALDVLEAEQVAFAADHGRIHILGQGAADDQGTGIGVTWDNLFSGAGKAPAPAATSGDPAAGAGPDGDSPVEEGRGNDE